MENVSKTIELKNVCQILSVGSVLANVEQVEAFATATATIDATLTETAASTETAHAHATATSTETLCHVVASVCHVEATEEAKEAVIVNLPINEAIVSAEMTEVLSTLRSEEINLNELFSTELSFVNGRLSFVIAPRVATV